jgi:hypothetical protein
MLQNKLTLQDTSEKFASVFKPARLSSWTPAPALLHRRPTAITWWIG